MQYMAVALAFLAFLSLFGVLGLIFAPGEQGLFIMVGGLVLFGIFAGLAAVLFLTNEDSPVA